MSSNGHVNILLVDDRPANLLALEAVLDNPAYHLVKAASGSEALRHLSEEEFALVLLDVQMPELDGFETARRIKRQSGVPIIFITAINKDPMHVFQGYDVGGVDYLMKPFDDHALRAKVAVFAELYRKNQQIQQQERALLQANTELQIEIQERQHAEMALRLAQDGLEQRVEERTAALVAALNEKKVLLKEIHHRVKNNLQIICSLLSVQARYVKDPESLALFKNSCSRIRAMALLHESLYQSKDLANIAMDDYVQKLVDQLKTTYDVLDTVTFHVRAEPIFMEVDPAISCALIINELVANALEHAFPDGHGEVVVELRATPDGRCIMGVGDNGIGLPAELDIRHTRTLGLSLVSDLTEQLHGAVALDRRRGARFTITIPLPLNANVAESPASLSR